MLSPHEVTELVPIGYHAVLRAIRAGELRASLLRGRYAVRESDVEEWWERNVVEPSTPAAAVPSARLGRPSAARLTDAGGFRARARQQRGSR